MWRSISSIVMVVSLAACASAANAPTVDPTATTTSPPTVDPAATTTPPTKGGSPSMCQNTRLPRAVLSYGGKEQAEAKVSTNWQARECAFDAHPFLTVPLPDVPLRIPFGESPELTFSIVPLGVSASVWIPDFSAAVLADDGDYIQIPLEDLRGSTRLDIEIKAAVSQTIDLSKLPAGDYAIEVFAGWDDGQAGWVFRVEIVEP